VSDIVVRYWAGARRAAGRDEEPLAAEAVRTVGGLRAELAGRPELSNLARVASFLVDGGQAGDDSPLRGGEVVDVLPPFAGG
jgi:sulfur-carrier protein